MNSSTNFQGLIGNIISRKMSEYIRKYLPTMCLLEAFSKYGSIVVLDILYRRIPLTKLNLPAFEFMARMAIHNYTQSVRK